jgi:hypothetical protein
MYKPLGDYVRIPDELIVRGENGLPVPNPEGEAVVCQQLLDSLIPPDEDDQS